ncbi:hypothetical protein FGO68_gene15806 [Halteria grandinella]|uniref:Uncharacterized protein n=1 Tax=Halteria grandinella TaxID=5974 RepID=A0A8J8T3W8_HALGN|nr:hypothetical protein FGO68_gene15806 [Halteria grandinella]
MMRVTTDEHQYMQSDVGCGNVFGIQDGNTSSGGLISFRQSMHHSLTSQDNLNQRPPSFKHNFNRVNIEINHLTLGRPSQNGQSEEISANLKLLHQDISDMKSPIQSASIPDIEIIEDANSITLKETPMKITQHAANFAQNRRKSQKVKTPRDSFFNELSRKGDKRFKQGILESLRVQNELKDCTFRPQVHPIPDEILNQASKLGGTSFVFAPTQLQNDNTNNNGPLSPKIISIIKKQVDKDRLASIESIHERLFKEKQVKEQQYELLNMYSMKRELKDCTFHPKISSRNGSEDRNFVSKSNNGSHSPRSFGGLSSTSRQNKRKLHIPPVKLVTINNSIQLLRQHEDPNNHGTAAFSERQSILPAHMKQKMNDSTLEEHPQLHTERSSKLLMPQLSGVKTRERSSHSRNKPSITDLSTPRRNIAMRQGTPKSGGTDKRQGGSDLASLRNLDLSKSKQMLETLKAKYFQEPKQQQSSDHTALNGQRARNTSRNLESNQHSRTIKQTKRGVR